jgi:hypothetical protein
MGIFSRSLRRGVEKTIVLSIILSMCLLTACKKGYLCTCRVNGSIVGIQDIRDTKKKANQRCDAYEKENQVTWPETSCELK